MRQPTQPPKKPSSSVSAEPSAPELRDDVTITLRIGAALRKAIYDAAAADKRSMNSTITLACEEWLAAKGYWTPKEPPKPSVAKVPFWKQPRKGGK